MRTFLPSLLAIFLIGYSAHSQETPAPRSTIEPQKWIALVQHKIYMNWIKPPSLPEKYECSIMVKLSPTGDIISVNFIQSCGHDLLDKSFLAAIRKSEPFPLPGDPKLIENGIIFKFIPQ